MKKYVDGPLCGPAMSESPGPVGLSLARLLTGWETQATPSLLRAAGVRRRHSGEDGWDRMGWEGLGQGQTSLCRHIQLICLKSHQVARRGWRRQGPVK